LIFTIPNLVSGLRVLAVPYFWYVLIGQDRVGLAAALIFVIGSTDWIDGYLARRLNQVSEFGKLLDPLADRLMIASALVAGLVAKVLPGVVGWPLLAREVLVGIGTLVLAGRGLGKLEVRWLGKAATFALYGAIPSFYLVSADIVPWLFGPPAWIAGVGGLILYWYVGWQYLGDIWVKLRSIESSPGTDSPSTLSPTTDLPNTPLPRTHMDEKEG
jgi:cardiolipin synthase (CMP-forming)